MKASPVMAMRTTPNLVSCSRICVRVQRGTTRHGGQ
jgi:hypothetical protein